MKKEIANINKNWWKKDILFWLLLAILVLGLILLIKIVVKEL